MLQNNRIKRIQIIYMENISNLLTKFKIKTKICKVMLAKYEGLQAQVNQHIENAQRGNDVVRSYLLLNL